jgi:hypothetical protein
MFLKGDTVWLEDKYGIYVEKSEFLRVEPFVPSEKNGVPEIESFYAFTMRPAKNLQNPYKQIFQTQIGKMDFPLFKKKDKEIFLYEMDHSFNGEYFSIIFDKEKETFKVSGPIF